MTDTVKVNPCPKCGAPIPPGAPQGLCPKCVLLAAATGPDAGLPPIATSEIPSLDRVAAAFPQLEILELLGRGGMGFVFKARQPHLDRFVALKLLPDKLARDPRFAERFNREGRVLARLNHPNIVSVYDFGKTEQFYFLLMEFVDGVNLRQAMQAGRFSPSEALAIVPRICEALQYAHGQGILHRDIKPENILLDARGQVKIADFGIAKLVGDEKPDVALTATGAALGTPHYMAPEQLEKPAEVDHRADIYSLGVVFYEMLTGELPIGRFAAPSSKTPVSTNVDEVVFRALEKDREKRFQSAGEVKTQVEHLGAEGSATSAVPPKLSGAQPGHDVPKWSQKAIWAAVLIALSMPFALFFCIVAYLGEGAGPGSWGVLLRIFALGVVSLPGLAGTILGWVALSDIRAHHGRLRGLPLAIFAAFAWPLFFLAGATLVVPWFSLHRPVPANTATPMASTLILLVPAGLLTFAIWAVYAAAHWGANKPVSKRRGVLKWIFAVLILSGLGYLLVLLPPRTSAPNALAPPQQAALGLLKLVAGVDYHHHVQVRVESLPNHPLHQIIARYSGPKIPERSMVTGPLLVPSPDEDMNAAAEPVDASITWGPPRDIIGSALSFECPGDYILQFVLPDEALAQDAAQQVRQALATPLSLLPGRKVQLFSVGSWKGWLEVRPFRPDAEKLAFFRHPGRSPAQVPGTNYFEWAVATIPPGHELSVVGRMVANGMNQPKPIFSKTLTSNPSAPGVYWFTWYCLPDPQIVDESPKNNWVFLIHDAAGHELHRSETQGLNDKWRRRFIGEPVSVRAGKPITQTLFEKPLAGSPSDRGPTFVNMELTMQPLERSQ